MFNWAKQQLANVAGTQEPIYGPSAIRSVAVEAEKTPYTEISKKDLVWQDLDSTNVETETFYVFSDSGDLGLVQIIYSNVAGIRTTVQFNSKVFSRDPKKPHLWCSTQLNNVDFNEDKTSLYADDCAMELSEDGNSYSIKSMTDPKSVVNLKFTRDTPGWQAGKTGKTLYGTDLNNPWGYMRHAFWPRCTVEGTITTPDGPVNYNGRGLYIYAMQGMKPHHAGARWTFGYFQGSKHTAVVSEFTTPPSYGSTKVAVGGVAKDGENLVAGCVATVAHTATKQDSESEWPEPTDVKFTWNGKSKDDKAVAASLEGPLGARTDRVDVMAEVPGFVKNIVAAAAGTKPYIYQYATKATLKLKVGDEEITEEGQLFSEATFICEI